MSAKEKIKSGWVQLKDFLLVLFLLNMLIGQVQKIDIIEMASDTPVKTVVIDNSQTPSHVGTASAATQVDAPDNEVKEELKGIWSAYNAEPNQTDGDPFTMASGKKVYEGAIANNCLDFGTKVKVNGKVKVVEDRMNSRYDCDHFDIYMASYDAAIKFGKQELTYEIIK